MASTASTFKASPALARAVSAIASVDGGMLHLLRIAAAEGVTNHAAKPKDVITLFASITKKTPAELGIKAKSSLAAVATMLCKSKANGINISAIPVSFNLAQTQLCCGVAPCNKLNADQLAAVEKVAPTQAQQYRDKQAGNQQQQNTVQAAPAFAAVFGGKVYADVASLIANADALAAFTAFAADVAKATSKAKRQPRQSAKVAKAA